MNNNPVSKSLVSFVPQTCLSSNVRLLVLFKHLFYMAFLIHYTEFVFST